MCRVGTHVTTLVMNLTLPPPLSPIVSVGIWCGRMISSETARFIIVYRKVTKRKRRHKRSCMICAEGLTSHCETMRCSLWPGHQFRLIIIGSHSAGLWATILDLGDIDFVFILNDTDCGFSVVVVDSRSVCLWCDGGAREE